MPEELPRSVEQSPVTYALTGEGAAFLTDEHRAILQRVATNFAGGRAVELAVVNEAATVEVQPERELEAVPTLREDFLAFAEAQGYTRRQGFAAWNATRFTAIFVKDENPPVVFVDAIDEYRAGDILDLESVHRRLVASKLSRKAWVKAGSHNASPSTVSFLAHLVNERVQPDEPLPVRDMRRRG